MTADILDLVSEQQDTINKMRIAEIRNRGRELEPCGECHFCESPVQGQQLFCDADCSQDYERTKR